MRRTGCIAAWVLSVIGSFAFAEPVTEKPWLQSALPEATLLYVRVPSPFGMLSAPKGNALDPALRDRRVEGVMTQIEQNLLAELFGPDGLDQPAIRDVLTPLRSPIEIAVLGAPRPLAVVTMTTRLKSEAALNAWLGNFAETGTALSLDAPLNDRGQAPLSGLPAPAWLELEEKTGRLTVVAGQVIDEKIMAGVAGRLTGGNSSLAAMGGRLDDSGFGALLWFNVKDALPLAQVMMPPEQYETLSDLGVEAAQAIAMGLGVAAGQARVGLLADLGDRTMSPIPVLNHTLDATMVGEPSALITFGLPSTADVARLIEVFSEGEAPGDVFQAFEEEVGFSLELMLDALGSEAVLVLDDVGDYVALRIRDRASFDRFMASLVASDTARMEPIQRGRLEMTRLSFADALDLENAEADWSDTPGLRLLTRIRDNTYFTVDGDYVYLADIPQPLIDRANARRKQPVGEWLAENQHVDFSSSVFSVTANANKLPRRIYYVYLDMLHALADLADVDIDIAALPTARELKLADTSPIAFNLSLGDPYLALELSSESSPLDAFMGGGAMQSVVVIGILAAIAVPAYEDYTMRSQISEGIVLSSQVKSWVAENYLYDGVMPTASEVQSAPAPTGKYIAQTVVFPDTGIIRFELGGDANVKLQGAYVYMVPIENYDGSLGWECSSWLDDSLLPTACQGNEPPLGLDGDGT